MNNSNKMIKAVKEKNYEEVAKLLDHNFMSDL